MNIVERIKGKVQELTGKARQHAAEAADKLEKGRLKVEGEAEKLVGKAKETKTEAMDEARRAKATAESKVEGAAKEVEKRTN